MTNFTETIERAEIDHSENCIILYGQTTKWAIQADGQCCSDSWFEASAAELAAEMVGFRVRRYEFAEYYEEAGERNSVEFWNQYLRNVGACTISAKNGSIKHYRMTLHLTDANGEEKTACILLHNASNGYYRGSICPWVYGIDDAIVPLGL